MEIRKIFLSLFCYCVLYPFSGTAAYVFTGSVNAESLDLSENICVDSGAILTITNMNFHSNAIIHNKGVMNGNINIDDGYQVIVTGPGVINSFINLGERSDLIQIIHKNEDVGQLNVNGDYTVLVKNAKDVSLNHLFGTSSGADQIILDNSSLVFNKVIIKSRRYSLKPDIKIVGNVNIYLDSMDDVSDGPILSNVVGDGTVYIHARDSNPLYAVHSYVQDGNLYGRLVRETDYYKIFRNDTGKFINSIRHENPNDKLLTAMDSATNMNDLKNIMNDSVRLNPIQLMNPIRIFNYFENMTYVDSDEPIGIMPLYVINKNFYSYGVNAGLSHQINKHIKLSMSLYSAYTAYSDYINVYDFMLYGGTLNAFYKSDLLFVNLGAGMNKADFKTGTVFNGKDIINNPTGYSLYMSGDFGKEFVVNDNFIVSPFVSVTSDYLTVVDEKDAKFLVGVGSEIKYFQSDYDVKYDYGVRIKIFNENTYAAAIRIGARFDNDDVDAGLEVGTIHDAVIGDSYNIRFGIGFSL